MKRHVSVLIIFLYSAHAFAQSYTVKTVPNPKEINNTYVSNPDHIVSESTVNEINSLLSGLEQQTTSQVAVVILNSIGEETDFVFAQKLFETWGIGESKKDNGLLILYVGDQRKIRFHTGYGLEGILPDAVCKEIQIQKMVPSFKEGNIDAGILGGVHEVVRLIGDPSNKEEIKDEGRTSDVSDQASVSFLLMAGWLVIGLITYFSKRKSGFSNSKKFHANGPHTVMSSGQWLFWNYFLALAVFVAAGFTNNWLIYGGSMYAYLGILGLTKYGRITSQGNIWLAKKEYHVVYNFLSEQRKRMYALMFLFPLPFIAIVMNLKKKIQSIRTIPRDCKNCGQKCTRLDEVAEDEYLSMESQFEETLRSVDYDIWKCNACGEISIEAYINEKTQYTECPKCKTHAFYKVSATTKVAATTSHDGSREIVKSCKYCNHRVVSTEIIPMIVASSSDSSSSSSSGSGGSFGGGDSGGGGASSSW